MPDIEQTALWNAFKNVASAGQQTLVRERLRDAEALLDRVIETFPTYTLHNHVHAENVVRLMGELLGEAQITALEGAMLLLSAYVHDTGMVFDADAREHLRDEEAFAEFLAKHPEAYIAVEQAGQELPRDIAEWYCRWHHAERVDVYLESERLDWDGFSLYTGLRDLCRSHGKDTRSLLDLKTNFGTECDLRFCAILLRLADILDFDRSRSPEAVYRLLKLDRREDTRTKMSDVEWRKHLAAVKFAFPDKRTPGYQLDFAASPDDPGVEHDLRAFLDTIESEFRESAAIISTCSDGWRDHPLPLRIERGNIESQGYKYGEHRFTLDRSQVLNLFMGENLYASPFAFVRELLQNAIDTSRHREFHEQNRGRSDYGVDPILVDDWTDRDGYRWVRVRDFGMGMDEHLLTAFFLKVGESYYRSAEFRADALRYATGDRTFTPISRFGIGVLSCFLAADRVEVSTRRAAAPPVRLSLTDLEGFYKLQIKGDVDAPDCMPEPGGEEPGYRRHLGTTVAVRLDPRKEGARLDLREVLTEALFAPPVPVEYEGARIGGDPARLLDRPWCDPVQIDLDREQIETIAQALDMPAPDALCVRIVPLDLTAASPDPEFKGQAVVTSFTTPTGDPVLLPSTPFVARQVNVGYYQDTIELYARRQFDWDAVSELTDDEWDSDDLKQMIEDRAFQLDDEHWALLAAAVDLDVTVAVSVPHDRPVPSEVPAPERESLDVDMEPSPWSHNGVRIPGSGRLVGGYGDVTIGPAAFGFLDGLRPEMSVSRDELRALPWAANSALNLAVRRAVRSVGLEGVAEPGPTSFSQLAARTTLGTVLDDPLIDAPGGWRSEPILQLAGGGFTSIDELALDGGWRDVLLPRTEDEGFPEVCASGLLTRYTTVELVRRPPRGRSELRLRYSERPPDPGHLLFPPLTFVPYGDSGLLRDGIGPVNLAHPFAAWVIASAPELAERFPGILSTFQNAFAPYPGMESEDAETLVGTLERLERLDSKLAPPRSVWPTADDFDYGFETDDEDE